MLSVRTKTRRRIILAALLTLLVPPFGFVGYIQWSANLGTVQVGRIFRSGQMSSHVLERVIRERGVKTVLNLRGPNPEESWYRDERSASNGAGASQVDIAMSSCQWMSRAQLREVVRVLETAERPLLIHCQWGSERTSLVSAIAELLREGSTLEEGAAQFSLRHMFLPVKDGKVMAGHFDQYAGWLATKGWSHSPDRFRLWVAEGFIPRSPSREQWPYDPYPLVVITRPPDSSREPEGPRKPAMSASIPGASRQ